MQIKEVSEITPALTKRLLTVWESSVRATHLFLTPHDIQKIKQYVPEAINSVAHLVVLENHEGLPVGFMGVTEQTLEMLFIEDAYRGMGLGKQLLNHGIDGFLIDELVVNEQNPSAKGFYEHMGFEVEKRSETDLQGNAFPILYMKRRQHSD